MVPKRNRQVRICVDLTRLNQSVCRERHTLPAVDQTLAQLEGAKVFTKLDANSGFWQISKIGTANDIHYARGALLLPSSSVWDFLSSRKVEHDERLVQVLHRLQEAGITLNSSKCQFSQSSVTFLSNFLNGGGIQPDPEKVAAVRNFRTPQSVVDVRRFLGMVNQLSKFSDHLADMTKPLRELLLKDRTWVWGEAQQQAFNQIKEMITESPILGLFDPKRVAADASSYGLGAVLLQRQNNREIKPIPFVSRALTPTEFRYAQIEKEALGITWAC